MAKDKSKENKEKLQGLYILFKSSEGKVVSKMRLEKATISDISGAIVWCELTKEKLLKEFKKLAKIENSRDFKEI